MLGETFTILRPVYFLIIIILILNLIYMLRLKNKIDINTYMKINTLLILIIGGILLFQEGIIVDELNQSGDSLTSIIMIISSLLFLASLFIKDYQK